MSSDVNYQLMPLRSVELGKWLRHLREKSNRSAVDVCRHLGFSQSKMTNLELGKRQPMYDDVVSLLALFGFNATCAVRDRLLRTVKYPIVEPCMWVPATPDTLPGFEIFAAEVEIVEVVEWAPVAVPTVLRTPEYLHAVIKANPTAPMNDDVRAIVDNAVKVQRILRGQMTYTAILSPRALTSVPFSAQHADRDVRLVLRDQLDVLTQPGWVGALRVVPDDVALEPYGGSWRLMQTVGGGLVVSADLFGGTVYLTDEAAAPYAEALARLRRVSSTSDDATSYLRSLVADMDSETEGSCLEYLAETASE